MQFETQSARARDRRGAFAAGAAQAQISGQRDQDRRAHRHVGPVRRPRRRGLGRRGDRWRSRTRASRSRHEGRGRLGRPPEQARRRLGDRARSGSTPTSVDMIVDVPNSGVALAVSQVAKEKNKVVPRVGRRLVGPDRQGVLAEHRALGLRHVVLANGTGSAIVKAGGDTLVLPHRRLRVRPCARARHRRGGRQGNGGKVLGAVQASAQRRRTSRRSCCRRRRRRRKIIGLANAGGDTINSIKQAAEFGIVKGGQKLAGLLVFITDVHSLGPADRAGPEPDRHACTGTRTTETRAFVEALRRAVTRACTDDGAGRRLLVACCIT